LRERFRQNHARHQWIAGKMSGEHRIAAGKLRLALGRRTRIARDQLSHEHKRRPMRQTEKVTSEQ